MLTNDEEVGSIGDVVVSVAPNDPAHAEESDSVQTSYFAAIVHSEELLAVGVKRAVEQELDEPRSSDGLRRGLLVLDNVHAGDFHLDLAHFGRFLLLGNIGSDVAQEDVHERGDHHEHHEHQEQDPEQENGRQLVPKVGCLLKKGSYE